MTREEILAISELMLGDPDECKLVESFLADKAKEVKLNYSKMNLQKFIDETTKPEVRMYCGINPIYENWLRPHIICGDDTRISVQASYSHYCYPRESWLDKYENYEVMVFGYDGGHIVDSLTDKNQIEAVRWFIDNYDMGEPFAFVPHNVLQGLIESLGGIKGIRNRVIKKLIPIEKGKENEI